MRHDRIPSVLMPDALARYQLRSASIYVTTVREFAINEHTLAWSERF
jgi:hypothetical protein